MPTYVGFFFSWHHSCYYSSQRLRSKFGTNFATTYSYLFVYCKDYYMNQTPSQVVIFTVYNADGEGSADDLNQYPFHEEKTALRECASFMKDMVKESDLFLGLDPTKEHAWVDSFSQALQQENIRKAMDIFNDTDNQSCIQVSVKTLDIK